MYIFILGYLYIKINNIMRLLKLENMTFRNGKLYHEGIRSILKRENIKLQKNK